MYDVITAKVWITGCRIACWKRAEAGRSNRREEKVNLRTIYGILLSLRGKSRRSATVH